MVRRRVSSEPTRYDVNSFLDSVYNAFWDQPAKYEEIVNLMPVVLNHRQDRDIIARVDELLKDHWELLLRFYDFLPDEFKINMPPKPEFPTLSNAFAFLNKVKEAFHDEPAKYDDCINILADFQTKGGDRSSTVAMLEKLMNEHRDLLPRFSFFFLDETKLTIPPQAQGPTPSDSRNFNVKVKEAFHDKPAKYGALLKTYQDLKAKRLAGKLNRVDKASFIASMVERLKDHRDLLLDFSICVPEGFMITIPPVPVQQAVPHNNNKRKLAESFMRKFKTRFGSLETHVVDTVGEIMKKFEKGNKPTNEEYQEVVTLIQGDDELEMELSNLYNAHADSSASTSPRDS